MNYKHLDAYEREVIAREVEKGSSLRAIARRLERDPGTISRELSRHRCSDGDYWATEAHACALRRRRIARRTRKLANRHAEGVWFSVRVKLRRHWSPAQITAWLKRTYPDRPER